MDTPCAFRVECILVFILFAGIADNTHFFKIVRLPRSCFQLKMQQITVGRSFPFNYNGVLLQARIKRKQAQGQGIRTAPSRASVLGSVPAVLCVIEAVT